jgi:hypothetical protein
MTKPEQEERHLLIADLKRAGLRKVFLGVESGSPAQLKRYFKGHTVEDAENAIKVLRELGVAIELGWIMFDPLCDLTNLQENVSFLRRTKTAANTSYLFNELRIQPNTGYYAFVTKHEAELGAKIIGGPLDPNTLSYPYAYVDPKMESLVKTVREWSVRLRPLHYPLKNLTRFGNKGPLGSNAVAIAEELGKFRVKLLGVFDVLLRTIGTSADGLYAGKLFQELGKEFAKRTSTLLACSTFDHDDSRIRSVLQELSRELLD